MLDKIQLIENSWARVSEALGDLADCFQNELPEVRVSYAVTSVMLQISKFMNGTIACLDDIEKGHPNISKSRRTGFNYHHLVPRNRPKDAYNSMQVQLLDVINNSLKITYGFRRDEVADFAGVSVNRTNEVIGSLKSSKQIVYSELENDYHCIQFDLLDEISIPRNGLSRIEAGSLKNYLDALGTKNKTLLSAIFELRNEEHHHAPIPVKIKYMPYYKVGTSFVLNYLLDTEAGAKLDISDSVVFLAPVSDLAEWDEWLQEKNVHIEHWLHFNYKAKPHGYRELCMPSERLSISSKGCFTCKKIALSSSEEAALLFSRDSIVNLSNVVFVLPDGPRPAITMSTSGDLATFLPITQIDLPVITVSYKAVDIDVRDIVALVEIFKETIINWMNGFL